MTNVSLYCFSSLSVLLSGFLGLGKDVGPTFGKDGAVGEAVVLFAVGLACVDDVSLVVACEGAGIARLEALSLEPVQAVIVKQRTKEQKNSFFFNKCFKPIQQLSLSLHEN